VLLSLSLEIIFFYLSDIFSECHGQQVLNPQTKDRELIAHQTVQMTMSLSIIHFFSLLSSPGAKGVRI
jgi:hypothetical protein